MAPSLAFDISDLDFEHPQYDAAAVEKVNPHRHPMRMLDAVVVVRQDCVECVAYKDVGAEEFWVEGHIPGRPLFPGVLMLEAAAQLASFQTLVRSPGFSFLGFVGAEGVKFRGTVVPGDRLVLLSQQLEFKPKRCVSYTQGLVDGKLVFEAKITGMPL